jgi:hypothetical protein
MSVRIVKSQGELSVKTRFKRFSRYNIIIGLLVLITALTLAACGDSATSAPASQPTTAAANSTSGAAGTVGAPGTGANNGTPSAAGNNGAPGGGNFGTPLTGTIESYDASAKVLTVKGTDGQSQKFDATNSRITKTQKITTDDLTKLIAANGVVQVTGDKASDGSYTATRLTVLEMNSFGNGAGNNGTPGRGAGQGGTPPANFTPRGDGTPRTGGTGRLGGAGANSGVVLRSATLSGNKLTGQDFSGATITVNLSNSTSLVELAAGSASDLQAGQTVNVNYRAAQGSANASAIAITIE